MALVGLEASLMPDRSCQDALRGALGTSVPFRGSGGTEGLSILRIPISKSKSGFGSVGVSA
jgi:hypothetical protein